MPEVGEFEIRQPVTLSILAEGARRAVTHWLVFEVTMNVGWRSPDVACGGANTLAGAGGL
jgi:hypothetical protein